MRKILLILMSFSAVSISSFAEPRRPINTRPVIIRPHVPVVARPSYGGYYEGGYIAPSPVVGSGCSMHYIDNEFVRDCSGSVSRPYYGNGGVVYR